MAFSRKSMTAAVAGSLSLALLTGCPPPTPAPIPSPTATTPGTTPTATPATDVSAAPASPGASATPAPVTSAPSSNLGSTTVRGTVYDQDGARVDTGAKVTVTSLAASAPFTATVDVVNGAYVVNQVPAGVQVSISAARDGWTTRTKVETLLPLSGTTDNTYNFGGGTDGYFISKYPEITAVEPTDNASGVDPNKVSVKLTLSESLDTTNQNRLRAALRVFPGNVYSDLDKNDTFVGGLSTYDLEGEAAHAATAVRDAFAGATPNASLWAVKEGSRFLNSSSVLSTVTFDAEGKVATLTFNAPVVRDDANAARYQVALVTDATNPAVSIVDKDSNQLGTSRDAATLGTTYGTSDLIYNAFKRTSLPTLSNATLTAAERWNQTHNDATNFEANKDDVEPLINSVSVSGRNIITLTFSEPMVAFDGMSDKTGWNPNETPLYTLSNYVFSMADSESGLASDTTITGAVTATASSFGNVQTNNTPFTFASNATIEVDPVDPKVVRILATDNSTLANTKTHIKVRVINVTDIAGNTIESNDDVNVKKGTI